MPIVRDCLYFFVRRTCMKIHPMKNSVLFLMCCALTLTACEKEEVTPTPNAPTPVSGNANTALYFSDADGVLVSIESATTTQTPIGPIDVPVGLASAFFTNTTGDFTTFANVGAVSVDGQAMTNNNNIYISTLSPTSPSGISWTNGTPWEVAGAGSFPRVSTFAQNFPGSSWTINSVAPSTTAAYVLSWSSVSNADSVICMIVGGSSFVTKTVAGNQTTCNFTAAQIASVGAGSGLLQVTPYQVESNNFNGKKIYRIMEVVKTKTVTIN